MIEAILAGLAVLISSGAAYYSRQQALPAVRRREICGNLTYLRDALRDVAHTGRQIGRYRSLHRPKDLDELIHLLEVQQDNLAKASHTFEVLAGIFDSKLPSLRPLSIHLRGKRDRIDIIYSAAQSSEVRSILCSQVEPWETNVLLKNASELREWGGAVSRTHRFRSSEIEVAQRRDPRIGGDPDFASIRKALPGLEEFIEQNCRMEDLI